MFFFFLENCHKIITFHIKNWFHVWNFHAFKIMKENSATLSNTEFLLPGLNNEIILICLNWLWRDTKSSGLNEGWPQERRGTPRSSKSLPACFPLPLCREISISTTAMNSLRPPWASAWVAPPCAYLSPWESSWRAARSRRQSSSNPKEKLELHLVEILNTIMQNFALNLVCTQTNVDIPQKFLNCSV